MDTRPTRQRAKVARRTLLRTAAGGAVAVAASPGTTEGQSAPVEATPAGTPMTAPARVTTRMTVNGKVFEIDLDSRTSLLDALREQIGLAGAKKGCDHGQCGACTVHLDGQRVVSCLTMAVQADGREVDTIEGLAGADGALHPMQQAFIDHDALQCGYCTPGQIMSAVAAVREGNTGSDAAIRETMSGNLCRCGAYVGIAAAVRQAAPQIGGE